MEQAVDVYKEEGECDPDSELPCRCPRGGPWILLPSCPLLLLKTDVSNYFRTPKKDEETFKLYCGKLLFCC